LATKLRRRHLSEQNWGVYKSTRFHQMSFYQFTLFGNGELSQLIEDMKTIEHKTDKEKKDMLKTFLKTDIMGWTKVPFEQVVELRNFITEETDRLRLSFKNCKKKRTVCLKERRLIVKLIEKLQKVNEVFGPAFFENEKTLQKAADEFVNSGIFARMQSQFSNLLTFKKGTLLSEWLSDFKAAFSSWRTKYGKDHIILFFCIIGGLAILWFGGGITGVVGSIIKTLNVVNQTMLKIPFLHLAHFIPGLITTETKEERTELAKKAAIDSTLVILLRYFFKYTLTYLTGFDPSNHVMLVMSIVTNVARQAPTTVNTDNKKIGVFFSFTSMMILGVGLFNTATGTNSMGVAYHSTLELITGALLGIFLQTVGQRYQQEIRNGVTTIRDLPLLMLNTFKKLLNMIVGLIYHGVDPNSEMGAIPGGDKESVGKIVEKFDNVPNYVNPQDASHILSSVKLAFGPSVLFIKAQNGKCLNDFIQKYNITI
jgi:hypothetical protein